MGNAASRQGSFFGIDLAWSESNLSGACVVDAAGRVIDERLLGDDSEVLAWIESHLEPTAVVAVDAPLCVPNETGRRHCEAELAVEYGGRKAGPHPANRRLLADANGSIRGERLAESLTRIGFAGPWQAAERTLLEVYPHPTIIEAFGLSERLVYKAKKGVSVDRRRQGLRELATHLHGLEVAAPPLRAPLVRIGDEVRGRALKAIEDQLDARVCAWVALLWHDDPRRVRLFGDQATGHIAVPHGRAGATSGPGAPQPNQPTRRY